jgi:hypothetical protein
MIEKAMFHQLRVVQVARQCPGQSGGVPGCHTAVPTHPPQVCSGITPGVAALAPCTSRDRNHGRWKTEGLSR